MCTFPLDAVGLGGPVNLQTGVVGLEVTHQVLRQAEVNHCNTANTADKCRAAHCELLNDYDYTVKSAYKL